MTVLEHSLYQLKDYYRHRDIQKVIFGYLGVKNFNGIHIPGNFFHSVDLIKTLAAITPEYLVVRGRQIRDEKKPRGGSYARSIKPFEWPYYANYDPILEVASSIWRKENYLNPGYSNLRAPVEIIIYMDMEGFDKLHPGEVLVNQEGWFQKLEAAYQVLKRNLCALGVQHTFYKTGQGYNILCKVSLPPTREIVPSEAYWKIMTIGNHVEPSILEYIMTPKFLKRDRMIPELSYYAFRGATRLVMYFMQSLIGNIRKESRVSVEMSDIGMQGVNCDCTHILRIIDQASCGIGFGPYLKSAVMEDKVGYDLVHNTRIPIRIPRSINGYEIFGNNIHDMVSCAFNYDWVYDLASKVSGEIPDGTVGIGRLCDAYFNSGIYKLHQWMDSEAGRPPHQWPNADDRMYRKNSDIWDIVRHANPKLKEPGALSYFINTLFEWGESPRRIAERIAGLYNDKRFDWNNFFANKDQLTHGMGWTLMYLGWRFVD